MTWHPKRPLPSATSDHVGSPGILLTRHRSRSLAVPSAPAFTLTELLVVMGLIAMLLTLLLPVVTKARAASHAAKCLANLREMGNAWTMYIYGNSGSLPPYAMGSKSGFDTEWNSYWISILDSHGVRGDSVICPSAVEASTDNLRRGCGSVTTSWTGKYDNIGTPIRATSTNWRDGSYGYSWHMFARRGWGEDGLATKLTAVRDISNVPLFFDCVWTEAQPPNHGTSGKGPADPPPNLLGTQVGLSSQEQHWRFLLSRHGHGINFAMADGSARWVRLEDTYMLKWKYKWDCYSIPLPAR
jgi:prepilin-type processing-associated H-X9-DG protein